MFRCFSMIIAGALLLAILPLGSTLEAQTQSTPLSIEKIRDGIYIATGGYGANTGVVIGDKAVLCVDAKMSTAAAKEELAAIAKLTDLPVTTMILTHSDLDHVNGLGGFPPSIRVISQENAEKDMESAFQKDPKLKDLLAYLPGETFRDKLDLDFDGRTVKLFHFGPAHTNGDVVVFFPGEKVAFIGDLAFVGRDPLVHVAKGGSSFGLVHNLREILKLDADVFISGHNDPLGRSDLETLVKSIEDKQAKVKAMVAEGKTLDEVKAAFGIKDEAGQSGRRWPSLVEIIYQEVAARK
jgi:cyclase